jgi:hypothetical protein
VYSPSSLITSAMSSFNVANSSLFIYNLPP